MVDYFFTDNSGTYVKCRTDAVDQTANNFTIMEVNDAPGGFYLLSFALQQAFGRNLAQLATTKAAMIALSQQLGYNLTCVVVGVPSGQAGPFVVNSIQLATPTLVAATGS